ncbi:hypothetical protein [Dokdonella soli]|uniref:Porin n=1 Tax=Dokdonella soli TaxID=529810 RepID=A0ABN1IVY1_9GAMM
MKAGITAVLIAAFAPSAQAQTPAQPLDLKLPAAHDAAAATAADPPGTYYGDVGGNGDASDTLISGSFSTTVGYAKGFGTGVSNAATLNVSKQYDDGRTVNLHIDVRRSSGFPSRR